MKAVAYYLKSCGHVAARFAQGRVIAMMLSFGLLLGHTVQAQTPPAIQHDMVLEGDPWPGESDCLPQVLDDAVFFLENGTIQVEIFMDPNSPAPSDLDEPNSWVRLSFPGASRQVYGNHQGGGRYVFTFSLGETSDQDMLTIEVRNHCSESVSTIGEFPAVREGGAVPSNPQFQADFSDYITSGSEVPIHEWLNGLSYLTPTQR